MIAPCDYCYRAKTCKVECPAFMLFADEEKTRKKINAPPCAYCPRRELCAVECASFRVWERSGI